MYIIIVITYLTTFPLLLIGVNSRDVRLPPAIVKHPVASKIFRSDDSITLECEATGDPKPQYEWLKNGQVLGQSFTILPLFEGTIQITHMSLHDEGYYQCRAFNQYGISLSTVTYLRKALLAEQSPNMPIAESGWIEEGQPFSFSCNPTKVYPKPMYSWAIAKYPVDESPVTVVPGKRIQIDEHGNLHFAYVLWTDAQPGKLYKCNMFNPFLDQMMGGSYSRLSVRRRLEGIGRFPPTLKFATDTPVVALEGRNITIRCFFAGFPDPSVSWTRHNSGMLPPGRHNLSPYFTELTLYNVTAADEGGYRCTGSSSGGQNSHIIHVAVQAAPVFKGIEDRPHSLNVTEGTTHTINCKAHAVPPASVVWFRNGEEINFAEKYKRYRLSDDRRQLTITNFCRDCPHSYSDLGVIQCNASNNHGFVFADGYINVLKKTVMTVKPSNVMLKEREMSARLDCAAISDDSTQVRIEWYRVYTNRDHNDERITPEYNKFVYSIGSNHSLYIRVNNYSEWILYRGEYYCHAWNGYSEEKGVARVDAQSLPPEARPATAGIGDLWWIFVIAAAVLLFLICLICCCICCQRNKGDTYPVDEKERKSGNNPEKELADGGFHDYQRPEGELIKGSRASLSSTIKMDSDEEASLNEYGDLDAGKFTEDGSFIGDYGVDKKRGRAGDQAV